MRYSVLLTNYLSAMMLKLNLVMKWQEDTMTFAEAVVQQQCEDHTELT